MTQTSAVPGFREAMGTRIRRLRVEREMTAKDLAKRVGIHYAQLLHIETNQVANPMFFTIVEIAKVLDCELDYIAYGER
jgi:transcriptional regulator with XRE-family HTH domain